MSKRETETRTDLQEELQAKEKREEKAKKMPNVTPREKIAYAGSQEANVHLEIRAHSSMKQTRKAKERDDLVQIHRHDHRTEIRKAMDKVVMTEAQKAHQNILVKVRQEKQTGKANRLLCINSKKENCQKRNFCNY